MARNLKELFSEAADLSEHDRATLAGLFWLAFRPMSDRLRYVHDAFCERHPIV